jgi:cell division protein FtsW (lipid II flippase)
VRILPDTLRALLKPNAAWFALAAAMALSVIGIFAIGTADPQYAPVQAQWLAIGLLVMVACLLPHPRAIGVTAGPLLVLTLVLLVLVIAPGVPRWLVPVRNGARCWINLRFMMFQPAELAKIVFILALARYLRYRENHRYFIGLLIPFLIMFIPVGLIVKQPDLGSALLFPPAVMGVLVAAGARLRHLCALLAIGILLVALNVAAIYMLPKHPVLKPHQVNRIRAMISQAQGDTRYVKTIGYQQDKAMTLVGAGGASGYGAARAPLIVRLNSLPEDHNDMIFAVIVNRWGAVGGLATIGCYLVLVLSFLTVAGAVKDPFARLACVGFTGMLFTQASINIAMTLGIMPITGITLPFVSYGGSSLLSCFAMVGLVMNFASRRPAPLTRPSFEFDNADAIYQ